MLMRRVKRPSDNLRQLNANRDVDSPRYAEWRHWIFAICNQCNDAFAICCCYFLSPNHSWTPLHPNTNSPNWLLEETLLVGMGRNTVVEGIVLKRLVPICKGRQPRCKLSSDYIFLCRRLHGMEGALRSAGIIWGSTKVQQKFVAFTLPLRDLLLLPLISSSLRKAAQSGWWLTRDRRPSWDAAPPQLEILLTAVHVPRLCLCQIHL